VADLKDNEPPRSIQSIARNGLRELERLVHSLVSVTWINSARSKRQTTW
jgi:hypothetical protein